MTSRQDLVKDESILQLLSSLAAAIDPSLWQVVDHWEADLLALGIASVHDPKLLVYVSTSRQSPGKYSYECEYPPITEADGPHRSGPSGDGVSLSDLTAVLVRHLGLPDPKPQ